MPCEIGKDTVEVKIMALKMLLKNNILRVFK